MTHLKVILFYACYEDDEPCLSLLKLKFDLIFRHTGLHCLRMISQSLQIQAQTKIFAESGTKFCNVAGRYHTLLENIFYDNLSNGSI